MAKTILNNDVSTIADRLEGIHTSMRILDEMSAEMVCDWNIEDAPGQTAVLIERVMYLGATTSRHLLEFDGLVKQLHATQSGKR
jgi:hypothetical protein